MTVHGHELVVWVPGANESLELIDLLVDLSKLLENIGFHRAISDTDILARLKVELDVISYLEAVDVLAVLS